MHYQSVHKSDKFCFFSYAICSDKKVGAVQPLSELIEILGDNIYYSIYPSISHFNYCP